MNHGGINIEEWKIILNQTINNQVDIQCLVENNLNTHNFFTRRQLHHQLQQSNLQTTSVWASSELESNSSFQPGGTAIVTFGKTVGRMKNKGVDKLGRWSYIKLDGTATKEVMIVSLYQSCETTNDGKNTFHLQQKVSLSLLNRSDINPRRNLLIDLKSFLTKSKQDNPNLTIIILGDWNEESWDGNASKICQEFNLVDIWKYHWPDEEFNTYSRGRRRIDFALAPVEVASKCKICYQPFYSRVIGDH